MQFSFLLQPLPGFAETRACLPPQPQIDVKASLMFLPLLPASVHLFLAFIYVSVVILLDTKIKNAVISPSPLESDLSWSSWSGSPHFLSEWYQSILTPSALSLGSLCLFSALKVPHSPPWPWYSKKTKSHISVNTWATFLKQRHTELTGTGTL